MSKSAKVVLGRELINLLGKSDAESALPPKATSIALQRKCREGPTRDVHRFQSLRGVAKRPPYVSDPRIWPAASL